MRSPVSKFHLQFAIRNALLLLALCALPFAAQAQSAFATLSGTVVDQNGAVVPSADITITNTATGLQRTATSNDSGFFTVPLLPPSTYTVRAQHSGFSPVEIPNLVLNVGDNKSIQIPLKAGDVNATVTVDSSAEAVRTDGSVGTVVDRQFIEHLPLNGRSFQTLIQLTPGVVLTKAGGNSPGQFSVNGQRSNGNYFTVDGVGANIATGSGFILGQTTSGSVPGFSITGGSNNLASVDAVQEFSVLTSTFAPEFGRTPGGQVSIVTRSGTDEFHGSVSEYFRNEALDANDWFANRLAQGRLPLRQNDFGGVLGGPIVRHRAFFFFSYNGLRLIQPRVFVGEVPSQAARDGASAVVRPFLNAYPKPNGRVLGNFTSEFDAGLSQRTTLDATSLRVDYSAGKGLTIFGRYNHAPSSAFERGTGTNTANTTIETGLGTDTVTLGATLVKGRIANDLRLNYSQQNSRSRLRLDDFGGATVPPDSLIFPFGSADTSQFLMSFGGLNTSLNVGKAADQLQRQLNIVDTLSLETGSHSLKFGVDWRRLTPVFDPQTYSQQLSFQNISSLLAGQVATATIGSRVKFDLLFTNFSIFAQDTWHATKALTLTYGLRWDYNSPPSERDGKLPLTVLGLDNLATAALAPAGTPPWIAHNNNFAPRFGASYKPFDNRSLTLRGGFGVFYDLGNSQSDAFFSSPNFVFSRRGTNQTLPLPASLIAPPTFPFSLAPPLSLRVSDPDLRLPYTLQWNIAVTQDLGHKQSISLSYVGAQGRRLIRRETYANPNPQILSIDVVRNGGTSNYKSLQMQFQRRLSGGIQALAGYTWSKSTDNASNDQARSPFGATSPYYSLETGPSDFDVRHTAVGAITYEIPALKTNRFLRILTRNWAIDAVGRATSATPINVTGTATIPGLGLISIRPDLVPNVPLYLDDPKQPGGRVINIAAFDIVTPRAAGRQGTLGRNALRGLPAWQLDLSAQRAINLSEAIKLRLGVDVFNIFNHPNFGDPTGSLTSSLFGVATTMLGRSLGGSTGGGGFNSLYQIGGPRSVQLSLKLSF